MKPNKNKEVYKKEKVINWYEKLKDQLPNPTKLDKNFNKHHILPNSMILAIGGTGSGKTNSLMSFLAFKNDSFYKIILFLVFWIKKKLKKIDLYVLVIFL